MRLNRFFLLSLGISLSTLSACTADNTPQWMARGYTYEDNTPLSSPVVSSPWDQDIVITDTDHLTANVAAWQGAVYELVAAIEPHLPKDGTPINLSAVDAGSSQNMALDHYLRQILVQKGYNLTTVPDAGLLMTSEVKEVPKQDGAYALTASFVDKDGKALSSSSVNAALPFEGK